MMMIMITKTKRTDIKVTIARRMEKGDGASWCKSSAHPSYPKTATICNKKQEIRLTTTICMQKTDTLLITSVHMLLLSRIPPQIPFIWRSIFSARHLSKNIDSFASDTM